MESENQQRTLCQVAKNQNQIEFTSTLALALHNFYENWVDLELFGLEVQNDFFANVSRTVGGIKKYQFVVYKHTL